MFDKAGLKFVNWLGCNIEGIVEVFCARDSDHLLFSLKNKMFFCQLLNLMK